MTRNSLTIPVLLLIAGFFCGQAAAATTVTTSGEVYLANLTPEEAWVLALKRSRYNAIEQACGVMASTKFAVTEIARLMASIPPRHRAEDTAVYQIFNPSL